MDARPPLFPLRRGKMSPLRLQSPARFHPGENRYRVVNTGQDAPFTGSQDGRRYIGRHASNQQCGCGHRHCRSGRKEAWLKKELSYRVIHGILPNLICDR
ncbi:MAG: hypothetical protein JWR69_2678 [Pedosphaera sp.]|nr:hypothetical protein [Pedosphaera sp.]